MSGTHFARSQATGPAGVRVRSLSRPLVRRCVSINGSRFSAYVRDGASAEEIIEKVAKAHGGGVAKAYDKELNAHEIVAVKIGRHLLVKDDPDKVSIADFSQFDDPDVMKKDTIEASHKSKGGIHFFLGKTGIPVAIEKDGDLVFPNGEELRPSRDADDIHISLVDYDANPLTLDDLNGMYSGGVNISEKARSQMLGQLKQELSKEKIAEGHGGMRSEKLMLPDTSVLVLNMESGDIMTVSEHGIKAEGFSAPEIMIQNYFTATNTGSSSTQEHSRLVNPGLILQTDLGPIVIPFDGSDVKIPYLCVKVFDGRVEDAVSIINPADELKAQPERKQEKKNVVLPLVLIRNVQDMSQNKSNKALPKPAFILRPLKIQKVEREKSKKEQPVKVAMRVGRPAKAEMPSFRAEAPLTPKKRRKFFVTQPALEIVFPKVVKPRTLKTVKSKKKRRKKTAPTHLKPVKKSRKKTKAEAKKKSRKKKQVPLSLPLNEPRKGKKKAIKPRRRKSTKPAISTSRPVAKKKNNPVAKKQIPGKAKARKTEGIKESKTKRKTRRKKLNPHFLKEMLGLLKKSRKARAGSSR
jgi:hypothetical protein